MGAEWQRGEAPRTLPGETSKGAHRSPPRVDLSFLLRTPCRTDPPRALVKMSGISGFLLVMIHIQVCVFLTSRAWVRAETHGGTPAADAAAFPTPSQRNDPAGSLISASGNENARLSGGGLRGGWRATQYHPPGNHAWQAPREPETGSELRSGFRPSQDNEQRTKSSIPRRLGVGSSDLVTSSGLMSHFSPKPASPATDVLSIVARQAPIPRASASPTWRMHQQPPRSSVQSSATWSRSGRYGGLAGTTAGSRLWGMGSGSNGRTAPTANEVSLWKLIELCRLHPQWRGCPL